LLFIKNFNAALKSSFSTYEVKEGGVGGSFLNKNKLGIMRHETIIA